MIPEKNRPDLEEMPAHLLEGMSVTPIATLDEALAVALIEEQADWDAVRFGQGGEGGLPSSGATTA